MKINLINTSNNSFMICNSNNVNGSKSSSCTDWTFLSNGSYSKVTMAYEVGWSQLTTWDDPPLILSLHGRPLHRRLWHQKWHFLHGQFCLNGCEKQNLHGGHIWDRTGRQIWIRQNMLRKHVAYRGDLVIVEQIGDSMSWYSGELYVYIYIFQFQVPQKCLRRGHVSSLKLKVSWLLLWQDCFTKVGIF